MIEKEPRVIEQLATYKKKAQYYILIFGCFLLVALIIYPILQADKQEKKRIEKIKKAPHTASPVAESTLSFEEQIKSLKNQRSFPEKTKANLPVKNAWDPASQTKKLMNPLSDKEREWEIAEKLRALNSRKSGLGSPQQNAPSSMPIAPQGNEFFRSQEWVNTQNKPTTPATHKIEKKPEEDFPEKDGQYLIPIATIITAVLDQEIMSDYQGPWRGLITQDVYDVSGRYILIPKGSRLSGKVLRISNVNEPIQARLGLTVTWAILPNGKRVSFDKTASLDSEGVAAIKDQVDRHLLAQFLGVGAYAMLSSNTSRNTDYQQSFKGDVGDGLRTQFAPLASKYLQLVPTITIRPGTPLKIFIEDDIFVKPWNKTNKRLSSF